MRTRRSARQSWISASHERWASLSHPFQPSPGKFRQAGPLIMSWLGEALGIVGWMVTGAWAFAGAGPARAIKPNRSAALNARRTSPPHGSCPNATRRSDDTIIMLFMLFLYSWPKFFESSGHGLAGWVSKFRSD